jgi:hypothetical protein
VKEVVAFNRLLSHFTLHSSNFIDPVVQRQRRLRDMQESAGSIPAGITFDDWSVSVLGGTRPW